ncbi:hypothetical protein C5B42_00600 [Candidatus Cerribacteria bacterium 'Amazon FNV 2010 28 9']|uniref:Uncharacterized protein n=1 Tax=Candidatus Cerribacteria bacterium 'Amazon FNV 2010 28 9' TaxID=2081795 RepID=A0A317JU73_9BACT|nr:MAG: hypothetical protein C5B42_00600 [Candidatus Cerribacteria bacterium 'Amazon FNV 2010 28 9']
MVVGSTVVYDAGTNNVRSGCLFSLCRHIVSTTDFLFADEVSALMSPKGRKRIGEIVLIVYTMGSAICFFYRYCSLTIKKICAVFSFEKP